MAKLFVRVAEAIQRRVSAWIQLAIAVLLLAFGVWRPFGTAVPTVVTAGLTVAGIGLLGTSMLPLAMSPFDADEWDELSGGGQMIVLSLVTVGLFGLVGVFLLL